MKRRTPPCLLVQRIPGMRGCRLNIVPSEYHTRPTLTHPIPLGTLHRCPAKFKKLLLKQESVISQGCSVPASTTQQKEHIFSI